MNLTKLQYRIYKFYLGTTFAALILSVPLAFILPVEVSFENGILENAQVVILILAALLIIFFSSSDAQLKCFNGLFASFLILIAFRELSWGRVFFPIDVEKLGYVFVSMANYKYRVQVYIFLAAYILAMIFVLVRFVPVKRILLSSQPLAAFAVIFMAGIFSYIGDHGIFIGKECGQILEELEELILYLTLPVINFYYTTQQKNPLPR